jgi:competence protein ComEA
MRSAVRKRLRIVCCFSFYLRKAVHVILTSNFQKKEGFRLANRARLMEIILVALGLTASAALIFYNVLSAPRLSSANTVTSAFSYEQTMEEPEEPEEPEEIPKDDPEESAPAATSFAKSQASSPLTTSKKAVTSQKSGLPVNINIAGVEELKQLTGVGDVKARAIIAYRDENGPFQSPEDLIKVKGIGEKTLAKLLPYITVG